MIEQYLLLVFWNDCFYENEILILFPVILYENIKNKRKCSCHYDNFVF